MADESQSKGLPMTSKWDPEKLEAEIAALKELEGKPLLQSAGGYIKRTGPGLLQSAMTLGAGSAVASVVAGVSFGYALLWVQPVAMFLGIMMFMAVGNVVLTTGERPYKSFGRELHVSIAFLWALGTVVASVIWHFPQYGLAAGAARDLAEMAGITCTQGVGDATAITASGQAVSWGVGLLILGIGILTTWNYGSGARGIRIYEWFLRSVIALVILSFGFVVACTGIDWPALFSGFFTFQIPDVDGIETVILGAIGASVGINMTFLYPYSLLAKGWGKHHKTLSRWDLGMSMFLPFVLVTSLVIIAMANTVHPKKLQEYQLQVAEYQQQVAAGTAVGDPPRMAIDRKMKPVDAAQALTGVMGQKAGRIIFDLGFIAMTCGAISVHMVVCGFTVCEMFGLQYTTRRYRMFTLVPVIGILGVITQTPFWMPIAASAICLTMLPIAYIAFFLMANKRSYIGDAVGHGWTRFVFNLLLLIAIAMATIGAAIKFKGGVIDKLFPGEPAVTAAETPAANEN